MEGTTIWGIVSTIVAAIFAAIAPFIKARGSKYFTLLDMIIHAFDDDSVTTEEFNAIIKHAKSLLGK